MVILIIKVSNCRLKTNYLEAKLLGGKCSLSFHIENHKCAQTTTVDISKSDWNEKFELQVALFDEITVNLNIKTLIDQRIMATAKIPIYLIPYALANDEKQWLNKSFVFEPEVDKQKERFPLLKKPRVKISGCFLINENLSPAEQDSLIKQMTNLHYVIYREIRQLKNQSKTINAKETKDLPRGLQMTDFKMTQWTSFYLRRTLVISTNKLFITPITSIKNFYRQCDYCLNINDSVNAEDLFLKSELQLDQSRDNKQFEVILQNIEQVDEKTEIFNFIFERLIEAIMYPISNVEPHKFQPYSAQHPVLCYHCHSLLWGITKQGLRCTVCGIKSHNRCKDLIFADCLQVSCQKKKKFSKDNSTDNSNEKNKNDSSKQTYEDILNQKIDKCIEEQTSLLKLTKEIFNVSNTKINNAITKGRLRILTAKNVWSARLKIGIIEAKNLAMKDNQCDPYCTIQVGKDVYKTRTVLNTINPVWDHTFNLENLNLSDVIKIRVWDENPGIKSKFIQKLTAESDEFLGQVIINVNSIFDKNEWFKLERRIEKSRVSGNIHISFKIKISSDGSELAPLLVQYQYIHEKVFVYLVKKNIELIRNTSQDKCFIDPYSQIINEFATRNGVQKNTQKIIHFRCLFSQYGMFSVSKQLNFIMESFLEQLNDPNFKKEILDERSNVEISSFHKIIPVVQRYILNDLYMFPNAFPPTEKKFFDELENAIELLASLLSFQRQKNEINLTTREIVYPLIKDSLVIFYSQLKEKSIKIASKLFKLPDGNFVPLEMVESMDLDKLQNYLFSKNPENLCSSNLILNELAYLSVFINSVLNCYTIYFPMYFPVFGRINNLDITTLFDQISYSIISETKAFLLNSFEEIHKVLPDIISMYHKLVNFSLKTNINLNQSGDISYSLNEVFAPFFSKWFDASICLSSVKLAFAKDKELNFAPISDDTYLSFSVIEIFTILSGHTDSILKLFKKLTSDSANEELLLLFSKSLNNKIFNELIDYFGAEYLLISSNFGKSKLMAVVLLNNMNYMKNNINRIFTFVVAENNSSTVQESFKIIYQKLKQVINDFLTHFYIDFEKNLMKVIKYSIDSLQNLSLISHHKTHENMDANEFLQPILNCINECIEDLNKYLDLYLLHKVYTAFWRITLTCILREIMLNRSDEKIVVTNRHCIVIELAVKNLLKFFNDFHQNRSNDTKSFKFKCREYVSLIGFLTLKRQTTLSLIKAYIHSHETQPKDFLIQTKEIGSVLVEIESYCHAFTGDYTLNFRICTVNLKQQLPENYMIYISTIILGSDTESCDKKYNTELVSSKTPNFVHSFIVNMSSEWEIQACELQFVVRCLNNAKKEFVVGIGTLLLSSLGQDDAHKPFLVLWIPIYERLFLNEISACVGHILQDRCSHDKTAADFLALKSLRNNLPINLI